MLRTPGVGKGTNWKVELWAMQGFLHACLEIILCFVDVVVLVLSGRLLAPLLSQIVDKFFLDRDTSFNPWTEDDVN